MSIIFDYYIRNLFCIAFRCTVTKALNWKLSQLSTIWFILSIWSTLECLSYLCLTQNYIYSILMNNNRTLIICVLIYIYICVHVYRTKNILQIIWQIEIEEKVARLNSTFYWSSVWIDKCFSLVSKFCTGKLARSFFNIWTEFKLNVFPQIIITT